MQVSHQQQYSQYEQRNAAFVPPTRIVHQPIHDLSPPQTPGMSPPPMGMHQASQSEDLTSPQRPGAQNRQSTGFFSAFSRSKSASSGQILSPPATPGANQLQHAPSPPEQQQQIHHQESSPPSRTLAASPSAATHSTGATPNPDASVGGHVPPPPTSQQPLPKAEEPFALGPTGIPLHPELRSVLRLNSVHQQKIYYSGRLSKRVERGTDGTRPAKDEGWIDIWCQLGGVTLSIWNMQAIEEANARGEQVPPQYVNVTDAFVQVLGSVTFPATPTAPAKRYTNVLTLNTAGSNLLLFVCESPAALVSWAAALRLAAWEKSRLEEVYTAHLLRITLTENRVWKEPRTTLVKGQLEGWVRVRVAGQTDWKRFWVVISAGSSLQTPVTPGGAQSTLSLTRTNSQDSPTKPKKGRLSGLFSRNSHQHTSSTGSAGNNVLTRSTTQTDAANMQFFSSSKPKEKKNPILSVWSVTQAFAVYPERPDLITRSTLVKIEGRLGREEGAGAIKGTEAWVLIMPEVENGQPAGPRKMLEWVVALHDAFKLYGRPQQYSFNPHNVASLMFAYPIEPNLEQLFLERELAESLDPRDDATSIVRSRLTAILQERIRNPLSRNTGPAPSPSPPSNQQQQPLDAPPPPNQPVSGAGRQPATGGRGPALTPITERSTTGETRTWTAGDSISPPNWSGHGSMNNTSAEASAGSGILAQGALVRSPIEEEDESRPLGALWGSMNGATRDQDGAAATRGARPMSMAFGASNIEGPAATGADSQAQPAPEQPVATDFASRSPAPAPAPAASPNPPSATSGLAINTQDHARASPYSPPAHSTMALGTGVPEPGSVDLRGVDVEHRLSPGNGHAYDGHPQNSPHGSTASEKPVLAPIRTTALSPPPRHVEPPAEKPAAAQAPAPPPVVPQQPLPQANFSYQPPVQTIAPQQPPAQLAVPNQSSLGKHNSMSSGEDFIPREAAKYILDHDEGANNELGLSHSHVQAARAPVPGQRRTFESSSEDEDENEIAQDPVVQPWQNDPNTSPVPRQLTPMAFANMGASVKTEAEPEPPAKQPKAGPSQVYASSARASVSPPPAQPVTSLPSSSRPGSGFSAAGGRNLGRKPSGARAPPVKTPRVAKTALSQHPIPDDDEPQRVRALPSTPSPAPVPPVSAPPPPPPVQDDMADDLGVDALAALSFAERDHTQRPPTPPREQTRNVDNISRTPSPQPPAASPRPPRQAPSTLAAQQGPAFRSSFAPSKHAAERKAKAQAHQVASEDAMKRPGRANGKKPKGMATSRSGAWESSEEEDAQDQDEDGSDDEPIANRSGPPSIHAQTNVLAPQPQQQYRGGFLGSAHGSAADLHSNTPPNARPLPSPDAHPPQGRPLRGLPALPNQGGQNGSPDHFGQGRPQNHMYGPPSGPPSRAVSQAYDGYAEEQQQPTPPPSQQPYRGAYRQTIWNNNLDQTHRSTSPGQPQKDTFVQINPNETMTKAFTPQGLLQAGLQDKHDRSAKRQEELARESGASLLNVPNKPPPPQTGLLGAVTAHERDRKRDGGFGAVLTEREREKRLAEDRQRKIDDLQRQQLESQQSMYGGGMGMNPMMMNPMMTGMGGMPMGPMGGMGMMGFNPMMGAFDPQQQFQMWAAQQAAAEAYQRAMVSFSQAGSVAPGQGEEGGRVASPMPGMMGGGMGMGMNPMMGMGGMGMGMGMNPMMGGMSPMMTGMGSMPGMGGFGGSQFGGMGMPNGMGMGMQGGAGLNARDSEDGPIMQAASPAEGSNNPR